MDYLRGTHRVFKWVGMLLAGMSMLAPLNAVEGDETGTGDSLHSLDDYLSRALAFNPGIEVFEQRYEAAMERIPQAKALPDPMFQVTHFVESVQTRTGPQKNIFMLSQRLPWFGKLGQRGEAASAEAEALWYAYQNQQLMLARQVSLAYFEYGYLHRAIDLTEEHLELLRKLEPIVEEKVRAGGDLNMLLRLKVETGKLNDRLQSLTQKRISESARLGEFLALPETRQLPWPGWEAPEPISLGGLPLAEAVRAHNPALQMLERKVASAEARSELARLDAYPDLTLGLNYIEIDDPRMNPLPPDSGTDPWGVTLSVNIPLWRDKYSAAKREALASRNAVESEYEERTNALLAELSSSLATLDDANRRLELYGVELLQLAEQAAENSRSSYENGRTGILEVIDSERSLLDLQLLYWRAASDAWKQRVIIQTLTNQPILGTFEVTDSNE